MGWKRSIKRRFMPDYLFKVGNVRVGIKASSLPPLFLLFGDERDNSDITLEMLRFNGNNSSKRRDINPKLQKSLSFLPSFLLEECLRNPLLYDKTVSEKIEILGCNEQSYIKIGATHLMVSSYNKGSGIFVSTFEYQDSAKQIFLGRLCNSLLPRFNASLLHSAGVVRDNKALLFLGPGTAGKTTVTNLSEDFILSDDQVLVQEANNKFYVASTPFGKKTDGPAKTKIGGLFFLKKGERFSIKKIKSIDALLRVWYDHIAIFRNFSPLAKGKIFSLLYELFKKLPSYEMEFTKRFIDWNEIGGVLMETQGKK